MLSETKWRIEITLGKYFGWRTGSRSKRQYVYGGVLSNGIDKSNQLKRSARSAVARAVKSGKLIKPEIADCGHSGSFDAHHYLGYSKENWLAVKWLCKKCHSKEDTVK